MAAITETATGYPGYDGRMPFENGMLSEMLLEHGYNTFCIGKWHLNPAEEGTPAGPYHRWPLGRGFERFYGFLGGETNQWFPDLTYDNHSVPQPKSVEEGYHLSEDLADKAIQFILDAHVNAPDKPFFMYYATGAAHAPHQVAPEWIDKYKGKFDMGWDKYREIVFENQKKLGIFPADAELSRHDPDVPEWDTLSDDQKRLYTRLMEVFAGFLEHADHHFGRILQALEEIGELDNTLIMIIPDNGASSEGGVAGAFNEMSSFNHRWETVEEILPRIDQLGGPASYNHYPWGWAWAGNTPFRRWKKEVYRGGCTDNLIVSWPQGIQAKGELRPQYAHAIDMVPTVLEALGVEPPETIRGVTQSPIEGVSFAHTFNEGEAPTKHITQYFEMFGNRAIDHDGWRANCGFPGPSYAEGAAAGPHSWAVSSPPRSWTTWRPTAGSSITSPKTRPRSTIWPAEHPGQAARAGLALVGRGRQVQGPAARRQRLPAPGGRAPAADERPLPVRLLPRSVGRPDRHRAQGLQPAAQHHRRRHDSRRRRRGRAAGAGWRRRRLCPVRQGRQAALRPQLPRTARVQGQLQRERAQWADARCATSSSRPASPTSRTARARPVAGSSTSTANSSATPSST